MNVINTMNHHHDHQVWIFTGSLTVTLASVSAIGAALALAYFTCEHHYDDDDRDDDDDDDYDDDDDGDDDDNNDCKRPCQQSFILIRHFRPQLAILPLYECPRGCDCSW